MAARNVILQWNCRGLKDKRHELDILIAKYSPAIICLQETLLSSNIEKLQKDNKPLPGFTTFRGYIPYFRCIESGKNGVAIYVKNNVIHSQIKLVTPLQALAVRVTFQGKEFIVSNHYTSDTHDGVPTVHQFKSIIDKFDKPFIMCGDFNAKNTLWSNDENNRRGEVLEKLMFDNDLGLLNSDVKTRFDIRNNKYSLIDLSIVHPALYLDFDSDVLSDPHGSDHHPIIISLNGDLLETDKRPKWNFKKADWSSFQRQCKNEITNDLFSDEEDEIKVFTDKLLEIATDNIPMTSPFHKKCAKPWFDQECKAAKRERNKANRLNKRYPCLANAMKAKVANAKARRTFKKKKRESWKNYVSTINSRTPTYKVWNMIRKITGKNIPSHLLHLKDPQGNLITNKLDIANTIGSTFEKNSSSANYSNEFLRDKDIAEEIPLDFKVNPRAKDESYNKKFKLRDLKRSIKKSKETSPGVDNIHYRLLKQLPDETLKILLNIINKYWDSHTFPDSWREALVLPIPKPGKDKQNPNNFRPIALTSCICKSVERMVNERLIYYLEKYKKLTKFQAGFRSERGTIDQLVRLDTFIKDAFVSGDHVVGVFFDLAKAYDTTWKYGIMRDLHTMGLRGNLPIFIQNFLSDRTFQILLGTTITLEKFSQEEGVPQGAILSTTLFNVKLNEIVKVLSPDVYCSLYVDDFVIFFKSRTINTIERRLQNNIDKIVKWTIKNGFTVSSNKTVAMHFCKKKSCYDPVLTLNKQPIEFVKEHKFLGLIWDPKLTFSAHIRDLKKKCINALNIIRVLSHSKWGSDSKTLIKLFRSLVRSKLDYGCFVYMTGKQSDLENLNIIHRNGLRLALGAFKSSPKESLYVEANEPPLELRRQELAMKYCLKIKSHPENPVYDSIYRLPNKHLYENSSTVPLGESIDRLFKEADINENKILKYEIPDKPIWNSKPNEVDFSLSIYDKSTTNPEFFRNKFLSDILPAYKDYFKIYTDGSKQEDKAAFGVYSESCSISKRLGDDSSIFTAEIEAILRALKYIDYSPPLQDKNKFVIFCDSKSVLESIYNQTSKNTLIIATLDYLQKLRNNKNKKDIEIKFCWIPSHVGIRGNCKVDEEAKKGLTKSQPRNYKFPYSDYIPKVKQFIKLKWQQRWDFKHQHERPIKLHSILPLLGPFYTNGLSRKDEVVIHRIRIGHTRLTHRYLMEDPLKREPICNFCYLENLTIEHIMVECQHFAVIRHNSYQVQVNDMRDLFQKVPLRHILRFLKSSNLYKDI